MSNFVLELGNVDLIINIIKFFFINIFTYYTYKKITNNKVESNKIIKYLGIFIFMILIAIFVAIIKLLYGTFDAFILMIIGLSIAFRIVLKNKTGYTIFNTIISIAINYVIFFIALIICFIANTFAKIRNDYISLFFILIIYTILINLFLKTKRLKNGIIFLVENMDNEYFNILVLNLSISILLFLIMMTNIDIFLKRRAFTGVLILSLIMFITIRKSIQLYYKQKLLRKDLEETKLELEEKKKEIIELEKEILNYSKKSHSIAFKQKSLEYKLKKLTYNNEIATELDIRDKVKKLGKEISEEKVEIELKKTGIEEIDDMLKYMQSECIKNDIQLDLQINGNIHQMVNNYIPKEKLQILIADHIKNAIIAIQHSKNIYKNILVRIGKIDGYFSLYIYDTGIEFENNTLERLGKEPSTTHKEDGGTGMGFMNTFDTLKECKASLIIKEIGQPSDNNFTKVLIIKFDNKNDFDIISYRRN